MEEAHAQRVTLLARRMKRGPTLDLARVTRRRVPEARRCPPMVAARRVDAPRRSRRRGRGGRGAMPFGRRAGLPIAPLTGESPWLLMPCDRAITVPLTRPRRMRGVSRRKPAVRWAPPEGPSNLPGAVPPSPARACQGRHAAGSRRGSKIDTCWGWDRRGPSPLREPEPVVSSAPRAAP